MNFNEFGDPLTFHLVPPAGEILSLSSEITAGWIDIDDESWMIL